MSLFLFVFNQYFIGAILSEKSCQKLGVWNIPKKGDGHNSGESSKERGVQTFCTL